MINDYPTYKLLVHVLTAAIISVLLDWRRPFLPFGSALLFFAVYGTFGAPAGVISAWFVGFVDGFYSIALED